MKYKLINITTKQETLCDKVTIDGFDYYVSDETPVENDDVYNGESIVKWTKGDVEDCLYNSGAENYKGCKKVIATNNPNINVPKVMDKVEMMALLQYPYPLDVKDKNDKIIQTKGVKPFNHAKIEKYRRAFVIGYNKSQETHPFSASDMKSFGKFCSEYEYRIFGRKTQEELLQLWQEQQPKIVYNENLICYQ